MIIVTLRSHISRFRVYLYMICVVTTLSSIAFAIRFYHLNRTEKKLIGYWEFISTSGEAPSRPFYIRFKSDRSISCVNAQTGKEFSSTPSRAIWFANSTDLRGISLPEWNKIHRYPYDLFQYVNKSQRNNGPKIKILKLTNTILVMHNTGSKHGPAMFYRRKQEEIEESIVAVKNEG